MTSLIGKLALNNMLSREELTSLIDGRNEMVAAELYKKAREVQKKHFNTSVFVRGLIEISSYCRNDCFYCGIRKSNRKAERYRLSKEEILSCCKMGYEIGFRSFVLQGGEDAAYSAGFIAELVSKIKQIYPDCALTLSIGEHSSEDYQSWFDAGADRFLLRHETATSSHYQMLHPKGLSLEKRKACILALKEIGYQVGTGFMVGSPYQTTANLVEDLIFIHELQPHMVGIGPFVPHHATQFAHEPAGSCELTIFILAILRLMLPGVLLPATTALGTLDPEGREKAFLAGANVVMPNLSPKEVRKKYLLYDNKISTGIEAAESIELLAEKAKRVGYHLDFSRGDTLMPL